MGEGSEILRSYVHLLRQLSRAGSVSLFVPSGATGEQDVLVHDGRCEPLPELQDRAAALLLHERLGDAPAGEDGTLRVPSASPGGVLYRLPRRLIAAEEDTPAPDRRKNDGRTPAEPLAWIGLRFQAAEGAPAGAEEERWWKGLLSLTSVFVSHARSLSRALFDPVTGLPERGEFQAELDVALARVKQTGSPAALLLVGPDDFGWVNERLDRRSGDRVLREIATGLRSGLRGHDHVARYGGAIFTVLLRDTTGADARRVGENVVSRLSGQRYHDGILRLAFSGGIATAERGDAFDAHELIRRADQALSAAKRGTAGSVRVWEKGSDVEFAHSLDRLQGIFTGDKSKDYRNMRLLLDSIAVIAASADPAQLAGRFMERLFETLHARRAAVVERSAAGVLEVLGGLERGEHGTGPFQATEADRGVVRRALAERSFILEAAGDGLSLCALPLAVDDGRCVGAIVLEVASANVSFEGSDRRFLDALASELAVALDRARLIERERERQREETERLEAEVTDLRRVAHASRLAWRSLAMESVVSAARKVARTDTTVLITGESGTGKEMLAHTLHDLSARRGRAFVVVDCSAISPTLIESELFGHERGAFTGALSRKVGRLAQADGATVFLDEVGELPLDLQSKLLRFVQERQYTPVGGVTAKRVDARIIAATNVDLRAKVAEGRFREDLYHRLNVVRLQLPPLRERREDIVHLANIFLQQFAALYRRPAHHFTPAAERALEAYDWPGNVRELQNLLITSVLFCDAPEVDVQDLKGLDRLEQGPPPAGAPPAAPGVRAGEIASPGSTMEAGSADRAAALRAALGTEVARATTEGVVPIGKWLVEDLLLAADELAGGVARRGAELLGIPETTYRRQVQSALTRRASGLVRRSASWRAVSSQLADLVRSRPPGTDLCQWAEACLLAEIEAALPTDARTAAALLGVTEPTLLRRRAARTP